jgi:hypothetical protein
MGSRIARIRDQLFDPGIIYLKAAIGRIVCERFVCVDKKNISGPYVLIKSYSRQRPLVIFQLDPAIANIPVLTIKPSVAGDWGPCYGELFPCSVD